MSDHGHSHQPPNPEIEADDEDQREDARGALIVFVCLVVMAVYYISGWTFS